MRPSELGIHTLSKFMSSVIFTGSWQMTINATSESP